MMHSRSFLTIFLLLWLVGCQSAPRDAWIEDHFREHRAEFEELVSLNSSAYRGVGSLHNFDGYVDYLSAQPRYTALMTAVGASRSPVQTSFHYSREDERHIRDPVPTAIYFVLGEAGFLRSIGLFGEEKGHAFFFGTPSFRDTRRLVPDTDRAEVIEVDSLHFYRPIEDGWYVYRDIED